MQKRYKRLTAPVTQTGDEQISLSYGINGSLRKREVTQPQQHTEYYLFNSQGNLKAYSDDVMSFAYYGYNAANTRTYKLSLYNTNLWVNGEPQPLNLQWQNAMFYPNAYLTFNSNGNYTKHYYNGNERIASRIGENSVDICLNNTNNVQLCNTIIEERFRADLQQLVSTDAPVDMPPLMDVNTLQATGTPNDIFYYHTNHLGSTSFVTDQNQTITQGFLYAPFGEITTEYNVNFGNNVIPKYSFNAKELDEETGMYYYEARYYNPPVFVSRDPLFEQKPWLSPYHYCSNNPTGRIDPSGMLDDDPPYTYSNSGTLLGVILEKGGFFSPIKQMGYVMGNVDNALYIKNNLNVVATNFQVNIGNAIGRRKNVEGSPQNAIRHTLWSALMARDLGNEQAIRASNSHEDGWKLSSTQRSFSYTEKNSSLKKALQKADQVADLLNNQIGRGIGVSNPNADNKTLAGKVMKYYYANGLYTTKLNDGRVDVVKTRITKAQYDAAMKEIAKKGNNGLNE